MYIYIYNDIDIVLFDVCMYIYDTAATYLKCGTVV